jgi:KRAB domain-containing zinc finger protein
VPNRVDVSPATREAQMAPILGCWHGVEEACPEKDISGGRVSQWGPTKVGWKAFICDMCGPVWKDILHLAEHEGTHPRQKQYMCAA